MSSKIIVLYPKKGSVCLKNVKIHTFCPKKGENLHKLSKKVEHSYILYQKKEVNSHINEKLHAFCPKKGEFTQFVQKKRNIHIVCPKKEVN